MWQWASSRILLRQCKNSSKSSPEKVGRRPLLQLWIKDTLDRKLLLGRLVVTRRRTSVAKTRVKLLIYFCWSSALFLAVDLTLLDDCYVWKRRSRLSEGLKNSTSICYEKCRRRFCTSTQARSLACTTLRFALTAGLPGFSQAVSASE
jgi:hypothetical protein